MSDSHLIETATQSQEIFKGQIVDVYVDTVTLPNGKPASREVVRHCPAVAILAVTPDDQVILVRQYRHPTGQILLEVPAGKMDVKGEAPETCALRELAEETPYTAQQVKLIHTFYTAPGFCDELMYLYEATELQKNSQVASDEDEFVDTVLLSRQEVKQALQNDQITDAKSLIALQHWLLQNAA
ncbi:NUDIX hydrolase [Brackiella oedipodis]|uniref:NUDIX hydrolase n=1 Tax=Brackiella oedipodis TaxID=124225 RepID=UPI00048A8BC2|nr:NUDIX hydrolase [Brackiella oedipodis]